MNTLRFAALAAPVSAAIVAGAMYPTWRQDSRTARLGSAAVLFIFVSLFASVPGRHMCDEGRVPLFVMLAGGGLAAAMPFVFRGRRWHAAVAAWAVCTMTVLVAAQLTDIYHHAQYTGNPENGAGRLWHTPFTGLYPRHPRLQER